MRQYSYNTGTMAPNQLVEQVEFYRLDASRSLDPEEKAKKGQFLTPAPIAQYMASLFKETQSGNIHLLDAGAGIGALTAAFVDEFCGRPQKPESIYSIAYETDPALFEYLGTTFADCRNVSQGNGVKFHGDRRKEDFIDAGTSSITNQLFASQKDPHLITHAILNPPYKKIRSDSHHRSLLATIGVETSNLYTAFLAIAIKLLEKNGELVAITPRSFCNGPYFRPFRNLLLTNMTLTHIHVFESRNRAFSDDAVLQENIIFHATKHSDPGKVIISNSEGTDFENASCRVVDYSQIVKPDDPSRVIHIATNELDQYVLDRVACFDRTLEDIGLEVSTGRVVDFRAKDFLRQDPGPDIVPLMYPAHYQKNGYLAWPQRKGKKPNGILRTPETENLLLPEGFYVVAKRFTTKEEPRRISPAIYDPSVIKSECVAFENHLNVFHHRNTGLPPDVARGLAVFLHSSLVDIYFRQFSGHTQVNATDLRMIRYPGRKSLQRLGMYAGQAFPSQEKIDELIEKEVHSMAKITSPNPVKAKRKISDALSILKDLGLPKGQQNERSALTLLAMVSLKPQGKWSGCSGTPIGITPIMDFCRDYYGRNYAPNTRETFRRQTMHQFVAAGLVIENPDQPDRPINSPKWCYQIEPLALKLLQSFGTRSWKSNLKAYLKKVQTLQQKYAKHRKMRMIPVKISNRKKIELTPGEHNKLMKAVIEDFAPRFTPGGQVMYVGDTGDKWAWFDEAAFKQLGLKLPARGKMPDAVIYYRKKDWLVLVEVVTSHGPVDAKRRDELAQLFKKVRDKIVYVTAFATRSEMVTYLTEISWETEVWVAEAPTHLIHFNGERFLGPYDK